MTFEAAAYTAQGTARERVPLPGDLFDGTVNVPVMHQAVKAFLANQRQGNAKTKKRGEVSGGNSKPWKQKGTGRARQGSTRAPHWVGGGTVFGPQPRSYAQYVPRQVRALARKSAFNARAREEALLVIDRFDYEAPKTQRMQALVASLGLTGRKVLVLTDGVKPNVFLSARNLPTVHVMPYADVSTYHLLWSDVVLVEAGALGQALDPTAEGAEQPAGEGDEAARPARRSATKAAAKRGAAKKASATKAVAKAAAKKSAAKKAPARKSAAKKATTKRAPAKTAAAKKTARKSASKRAKE
jgi:large subunit ribosomal protein L4